MDIGKFVKGIKLKTVGRVKAAKLSKIDFGIVKVAFMIAALDGEITEAEYKALDALLKKCRGYSKKAADTAMDEAMRSAGYLLLLGRRATDREFAKAFIAEARAALPNGFEYLSVEEVRRAVVTWIAMGMSDGDYSVREKKCIEALRKVFAENKVTRAQTAEYSLASLASSLSMDYDFSSQMATGCSVTNDFVSQVERLVAQYGDEASAAKELEQLIAER